MSAQEIVYAYRHLYRQGLRAVQFSKPARYTLRDRIRLAFHRGDAANFNAHKISNTLEFLKYATTEAGLEHKVLKNLLFVWYHQDEGVKIRPGKLTPAEHEVSTTIYDPLNHTIRMLNESMEMCLPAMTTRGKLF
ncbi:DUF1763-domain-containing protein [Amniculicola lignicola CBS 123094]|uniref:DUF1763-domain-containing protein n=1 Tax=Amniculicola lignicola CBS 123094 TaxID=1392246 RepID=A0A6A5W1B5_9PLEO|nr:DUF1763-domain-containing protein [Amniculicola lignicola CBS 123094]